MMHSFDCVLVICLFGQIFSLVFEPYSPDYLKPRRQSRPPQFYPPTESTTSATPTFSEINARRKQFKIPLTFDTHSLRQPEAEDLRQEEPPENEEPADYSDYYDPPPDESPPEDEHYESQASNTKEIVPDDCLRCLCEASSSCDPTVRCHVVGPVDYYCGPFQISYTYWKESGSPGDNPSNPMAFEECLNEIECAIDTVNGYMQRFGKDCDGDGRVTCDDYVRIHKAGPYGCNGTWLQYTDYWAKYKNCNGK